MSCPFCEFESSQYWFSGKLVFVIKDKYPVSPGHLLIIPKSHRRDYFELSEAELAEVNEVIKLCRDKTLADDPSVEGFNIGANCGEVAGQTVFHCHIHFIPRRRGDDPAPRGGVRGVIDGKKAY